jgi:hypothetical protein
MAVRLDQLLAAFARAVVDAQHEVRQSHLGDLSQFFKNGSPITVDLKLPRVSPETGEQQPIEVQVPLAILVGHASMSIRETQLSMQVEVNSIGDIAKGKKAGPSRASPSSEGPYQWKPPGSLPVISVSTVTSGKAGDVGVAQLTLRVVADDVPEGLARLLDHLNKTL